MPQTIYTAINVKASWVLGMISWILGQLSIDFGTK